MFLNVPQFEGSNFKTTNETFQCFCNWLFLLLLFFFFFEKFVIRSYEYCLPGQLFPLSRWIRLPSYRPAVRWNCRLFRWMGRGRLLPYVLPSFLPYLFDFFLPLSLQFYHHLLHLLLCIFIGTLKKKRKKKKEKRKKCYLFNGNTNVSLPSLSQLETT